MGGARNHLSFFPDDLLVFHELSELFSVASPRFCAANHHRLSLSEKNSSKHGSSQSRVTDRNVFLSEVGESRHVSSLFSWNWFSNVTLSGGKQLEWNDSFVLYLTTKLSNPHFTPETMGKTLVINYSVTMSGLAEQLLAHVVGFDLPDLEKQRQELVQKMSEGQQMMKVSE